MLLDKQTIIASVVLAVAKLVGQAAVAVDKTAGAEGWIAPAANLTAVGALIYLVVHVMPKREEKSQEVIKELAAAFRSEMKDVRDDREKDRERFRCKHDGE